VTYVIGIDAIFTKLKVVDYSSEKIQGFIHPVDWEEY
jgi:hypothetical protein